MTPAQADVVIDGRQMEPPEPFVQTMAALDAVKPGQRVMLRLCREPFPLYRALELNGVSWTSARNDDGDFEILMWRAGGAPMVVPPDTHCPDCGGT
ncbi:MAG: SirA-like protein [Proteobacteria bacterium]|nr:SirA-like protein [Pseudomonadota bacterium]